LGVVRVGEWIVGMVRSMCVGVEAVVGVDGVGVGGLGWGCGFVGDRSRSIAVRCCFGGIVWGVWGGASVGVAVCGWFGTGGGDGGVAGVGVVCMKGSMGAGGLRVSVGGTRVVGCAVGSGRLERSGKCPCAVCLGGVKTGSVGCGSCGRWVHGGCGGIGGALTGIVFHRRLHQRLVATGGSKI